MCNRCQYDIVSINPAPGWRALYAGTEMGEDSVVTDDVVLAVVKFKEDGRTDVKALVYERGTFVDPTDYPNFITVVGPTKDPIAYHDLARDVRHELATEGTEIEYRDKAFA
jgi:hypothetical protein